LEWPITSRGRKTGLRRLIHVVWLLEASGVREEIDAVGAAVAYECCGMK